MAGLVHGFTQRAATLDQKGFLMGRRWQPFAVNHVGNAVAFALDLLQKQILIVALDVAHAPREFAVETAEYQWHTGDGDTGHLVFRCTDLHEAPGRIEPGRQLHVTGQQTFAVVTALWRDGPVTGGRDAEHVQVRELQGDPVQIAQAVDLIAQVQALELVGFGKWQLFVRVGRQ